jgi:Tfp pilus assembly protein PilX
MSSAAWNLQQAVHAALAGNADVIAHLGSARVYDDVPRGAAFPYLTLAGFIARDWATGTESGAEVIFAVNAWSRGAGHKQAHLLAEAVRAALHDAPLTLADHHLVNLRHETSNTHRERDGDTYRVAMRFRAVLEPTA